MSIEVRNPYIYLRLIFRDEQYWEGKVTMVPKRLERWTAILVVGEDWSSQKLRLVFVDTQGSGGSYAGGARAEMKELSINFADLLRQSPEWRLERMTIRSLSVTSSEDENDDEDDNGSW